MENEVFYNPSLVSERDMTLLIMETFMEDWI